MPDIRQIALDESSTNPNWQTCQTILCLLEMILRFCLVFTKYIVDILSISHMLLSKPSHDGRRHRVIVNAEGTNCQCILLAI